MEDELREWWTPRELADRWRVSVSTIYRLHGDAEADGFGTMIRGQLRVHRSQVLRVEGMRDAPPVKMPRTKKFKPAFDSSAPHRQGGILA